MFGSTNVKHLTILDLFEEYMHLTNSSNLGKLTNETILGESTLRHSPPPKL